MYAIKKCKYIIFKLHVAYYSLPIIYKQEKTMYKIGMQHNISTLASKVMTRGIVTYSRRGIKIKIIIRFHEILQ